MLVRILLTLLIITFPAFADASLETCVRSCLDDVTPTTPTTPTVPTTPTTGSKIFPSQIIFENQSDVATGKYAGKALILFPASWYGKILSVGLNGETGYKDEYKGQPVFRFTKEGSAYSRPLKIVITATNGQVYTAYTGSAVTPNAGNNVETVKTSGWANNNRDHYRITNSGASYGKNFVLEFSDGSKYTVPDGSVRKEWSDGTLWKPKSDNDPNKAVVLGKRNVHITSVTVRY
ncbi:MAG: hypothetical protein WC455_19495 [Dehalococcoidia bacterium]|jgi:hypothetical protein